MSTVDSGSSLSTIDDGGKACSCAEDAFIRNEYNLELTGLPHLPVLWGVSATPFRTNSRVRVGECTMGSPKMSVKNVCMKKH
jgi:hypothetical protein